ncbi:MAG TPA: hypothetical protein VMY77_02195 [Chitinophagaceae bacterium]|nr:hypothetical protein [Chitinophagaceae bacterium]
MAINKNHEFEELDGVKCGIVEKNVLPERVEFLKKLLEYNHYTVVVVPSPPPKVVPPPPAPKVIVQPVVNTHETTEVTAIPAPADAPVIKGEEVIPVPVIPEPPPPPETFTVGVTDYTFNPINAIFGRMLKTPDGHVVTQAYWYQNENISHDEIPYYEKTSKNFNL